MSAQTAFLPFDSVCFGRVFAWRSWLSWRIQVKCTLAEPGRWPLAWSVTLLFQYFFLFFHVFHTGCIAVVIQALTIHDSSGLHAELSHLLQCYLHRWNLLRHSPYLSWRSLRRLCHLREAVWPPIPASSEFQLGPAGSPWSGEANAATSKLRTIKLWTSCPTRKCHEYFFLCIEHAWILLDVFRPGWARPTETFLPTRPLRHPCTCQAWASWTGDWSPHFFVLSLSLSLSHSLTLSLSHSLTLSYVFSCGPRVIGFQMLSICFQFHDPASGTSARLNSCWAQASKPVVAQELENVSRVSCPVLPHKDMHGYEVFIEMVCFMDQLRLVSKAVSLPQSERDATFISSCGFAGKPNPVSPLKLKWPSISLHTDSAWSTAAGSYKFPLKVHAVRSDHYCPVKVLFWNRDLRDLVSNSKDTCILVSSRWSHHDHLTCLHTLKRWQEGCPDSSWSIEPELSMVEHHRFSCWVHPMQQKRLRFGCIRTSDMLHCHQFSAAGFCSMDQQR